MKSAHVTPKIKRIIGISVVAMKDALILVGGAPTLVGARAR
jgi:hypothetical protein